MTTGAALAALLLAGCGSYEYRDTNAAVDRDPACAGRADRPGEPVSPACERKTEAKWSSERKQAAPIDFSGKPRDD
ncbi:hypothetical protein [Luteimonas saliphila]|uniref:hypothetical protein n=1 Tax=Luteimonas saliphila TaxID=2804919 RepID=UPI001EE183A7|nr:hypothetical protein [Luteimonas saliphila]